eukprot:CAMPEP_0118944550 /NCGR_PEP_ID=MMETSP1169-20130426/40524_1 /TAXON_ID=36882 /ORGANISM="Pyramimonas obovata, Strain CCMP722" /LENGTH=311 /DNA_ID=CAMNT_0006890057 /DNA_START=23 /DNA_END=955 /DNA_ORIENTATION=-
MSALDKCSRGAWNLVRRVLKVRGTRASSLLKEEFRGVSERVLPERAMDASGAPSRLVGFTTTPRWEVLAPVASSLSATRDSSRSEGMGDGSYAARAAGAMMVGGLLMVGSIKQVEMEEEAKTECNDCQEGTSDGVIEGLQEAKGVVSNESTAQWRIYTDMGRDFFTQGRYLEAERYLTRALKEARKGFGEREAHVAAALNNLGELYRVQRDYSRAEPLYMEALEILEEALGPAHPSTAVALHNAAGLYLLQKEYGQAQKCYERSLEYKANALGEHHPEYATSLAHLAEVMRLQERHADAAALLRRSLDVLE